MYNKNILICGHKCTTACIACYFKGMPCIENVVDYSLKNCEYATYDFGMKKENSPSFE